MKPVAGEFEGAPVTVGATTETGGSSRSLVLLSVICGVVGLLVILTADLFGFSALVPLSFLLLGYCGCALLIQKTLTDPLIIFGLVLFQYSYLPTLVEPSLDRFLAKFPLGGAYLIHSWAIIAFFWLSAAAITLIPIRGKPEKAAPDDFERLVFNRASLFGSTMSIALSLVYAVQRGTVLGGDLLYEASFTERLTEGSGVLLLAAPLATAALAFSIVHRGALVRTSVLAALLAFGLLFFVHGQRKYLLIPIILFVCNYVRIAGLRQLILILAGVSAFYVTFIYIGFLRINEIDLGDALRPEVIDRFGHALGYLMAGESLPLFGSAAASYEGFVQALPFLGDYLLSWMMALPQSAAAFSSMNVRFAFALDPVTASLGYGWGFSYWGEGYAVAGYAGVFLAGAIAVFVLRWFYSRAAGARLMGVFGVISLTSLYFALWIQRNSFAYFVKEFLVYQIAIILGLYFAAAFSLRRYRSRTRGKEAHVH